MTPRLWWTIGMCAALALASASWWWWNSMQAALDRAIEVGGDGELFEIRHGQPVAGIAAEIAARGWLATPWYFTIEARRRGQAHRIQAGVYEVRAGDTPRELLRRFVHGEIKIWHATFIEGLTFAALRAALVRQPAVDQTTGAMSDTEIMALVGAPGAHPEGRFFPATYAYRWMTKDIDLLRRAYRTMEDVLARQWAARDRDLPYVKPYEALIMASIIEKETGNAAERAQIAEVFVRRLQRNMKLQADPTVIYGLGARFDGNLQRADLEADGSYNTYARAGLPPTPIAMPGEAAIIAALHPAESNSLYFVARGDGTHEFSATLEDHDEAVRRYQLKH